MIEVIEHKGTRYAEVLRAKVVVPTTRFFSPAKSSMQFGLLAHGAGFVEPAHVQRGVVAVDFFDADGKKHSEVILRAGDAILLVDGAHSVRVLEDMQCISVKQGPFLGAEKDKKEIQVQS